MAEAREVQADLLLIPARTASHHSFHSFGEVECCCQDTRLVLKRIEHVLSQHIDAIPSAIAGKERLSGRQTVTGSHSAH
eukprot:1648457-Rhodomonas_salina.4